MRFVQKINSFFPTALCILIFIAFIPLIIPVAIIYIPTEFIRYRRMPYYKDLKKKYRIFITTEDVVKTYNRIIDKHLCLIYVNNGMFEYFIQDNIVLLKEDVTDCYKKDDVWFIETTHEESLEVANIIEQDKAFLKNEHQALPIKILIFYSDVTDAERWERAKECPYFHCCFDYDELT